MELDFTGLDSLSERAKNEPKNDSNNINHLLGHENEKNLLELNTEVLRGIFDEKENAISRRYLRIEKDREIRDGNKKLYGIMQDNIKVSERIRSEILKDIMSGEEPSIILLKALKVIELMTGDKAFGKQGSEYLLEIHEKLGDKGIKEHQTREIEGRIARLEAAYRDETDSNARKRIKNAITAHNIKLKKIKNEGGTAVDRQKTAI